MWLRVISLTLLSLTTAAFSVGYDRHEIIGNNLLVNSQFHDDLQGWTVQGSESVSVPAGILTLSNLHNISSSSLSVLQTVAVPPGKRLLHLSCEARATGVVPGKKRWEAARVVLLPLDSEGQARHDVPHILASLNGTTPWGKYEHVFRVPEENTTVSVVAQLLNAHGVLEVGSISLRSAVENPAYTKWRHTLMLAWLLMGLWIARPLLRTAHRDIGRTGILVIGSIILVGVLMPASVKEAMTPSWLLPEREAQGPFRVDLQTEDPFRFELIPTDLNVYKLAHILLFASMGYLLISRRPYGIPIRAQIVIIALFALATESMQVLASGRDGRLSDVLIDLFGTGCGLVIAAAIRRHHFKAIGSA